MSWNLIELLNNKRTEIANILFGIIEKKKTFSFHKTIFVAKKKKREKKRI